MPELLTTDEAAAYLRMSERKLYELVAHDRVPSTKVTGRWLFSKAALNLWLLSGCADAPALAPPPPIIGGSQDPLLEWAMRESGSGLAGLPEGSEAGLERLSRHEVVAAAIHLHRLDGDDELANPQTVAAMPGLHDGVVIALVRREQGFLVPPGNPLGLSDIASVASKGAKIAQRQPGAGAQLLLLALAARAGVDVQTLTTLKSPCPTGPDLAHAIRSGRADCGIASRSVARAAGLDFVPLTWERFDLALRQRDYFRPAMQALFAFLRTPQFIEHATELGGYDTSETGTVRQMN